MRTKEAFFALVSELEGDRQELERLKILNARAVARLNSGSTDTLDYGALGFTIHAMYGVLENYLLRISKFFENNLPNERWHKALIEKTSLDIEHVRPAFFCTPQSRHDALELLKFRHRFRNLYGEDLDPKKTLEIQSICDRFFALFPELHSIFINHLLEVAANVDFK